MSSLSPGPIRQKPRTDSTTDNRHCRLFSKNEAARVNAWNAQSPVNTGPKNQGFSKDDEDDYDQLKGRKSAELAGPKLGIRFQRASSTGPVFCRLRCNGLPKMLL